ncbi:MAG TPA: hypothetical protein PLX35_05835 [Cyclobacteriaceae bacterium]|nr:hypothetical protein [Cyclobacteriaceae bacterium]
MGLFDLLKRSPATNDPYKDTSTNLVYNLLFCDNIELYKVSAQNGYTYPFDILFSKTSTIADYQQVIDDATADTRSKVLAYNQQRTKGHIPEKIELLGVIIEVGLDDGLDVLASFHDGTARYINQSGKIVIWEAADETSIKLTQNLFEKGREIIKHIGPWDKARRPYPRKGTARITFLVSNGLYFGEGAMGVLFNDPMAGGALESGTALMQYLTERAT